MRAPTAPAAPRRTAETAALLRLAAPVTLEAPADATDEATDEAPPSALEILLPLFAGVRWETSCQRPFQTRQGTTGLEEGTHAAEVTDAATLDALESALEASDEMLEAADEALDVAPAAAEDAPDEADDCSELADEAALEAAPPAAPEGSWPTQSVLEPAWMVTGLE